MEDMLRLGQALGMSDQATSVCTYVCTSPRPTPYLSILRTFRSLARWRARRANFSSTRKFRRRENFRKKNLGRRDRFPAKIVEIGAILAIFEPFEVRKFRTPFLANSADRPRIWVNRNQIRPNPGRIGRIRQKMACEIQIFEFRTAQKSRG